MQRTLKALLMTTVISAAGSLCCHGQMNVTSPAATEFVKYERIPVSYFNGLPSIDIPLYTLDYKDLHLPIHLSYYASGIQLNQYPTCVGLGWNLSAGGCITRVVNGAPDETCIEDVLDETGALFNRNPGYYYSSDIMADDNWTSEESLAWYQRQNVYLYLKFDTQPDEFVINAYGVNGSFYFYRDKDGNVQSKVKSNNGTSFRVEIPKILHNPHAFDFPGGGAKPLTSFRIHELFYEFVVVKDDGTKLIFGGDDNNIEFYTEKIQHTNPFYSSEVGPKPTFQYLKTWPTAWMLKEVISPNGNKMNFEYSRDGSPMILSDVRTDVVVYQLNGDTDRFPSQGSDRGFSFIVQHPVYPKSITVDGGIKIDFSLLRANDLSTVGSSFEEWLKTDCFYNVIDDVRYDKSGIYTPLAPHNYSQRLYKMRVKYNDEIRQSFAFGYIENKNERLKLLDIDIRGCAGHAEQKYAFKYNDLKLPAYNATVTDNWGYWNNKDYRKTDIENDFFGFRSSNEYYTKAEVLTEIQYPTGGNVKFDYELNDYSKVATQVPDFKILEQSGQAGGLRIKKMTYSTDTTSYIHSFGYKNEDGTSSGILSGIPVYVSKGENSYGFGYVGWGNLADVGKEYVYQGYKMTSEAYINALGLTTGNYVTYSRVVESVGNEKPLVKEYRYTNHDTCPDTADFKMYTNIDNVALDNQFTSRALMRGLIVDEIWYNDGKKVKEIKQGYNSNPERFEDYMRSTEQFTVPGIQIYYLAKDFVRYTPFKILTFYPYLESRTETLYDPSGRTVMSSVTENFTYNGNLMPTRVTKNMSDGSVETQTTTYPDDYNTGILNQMTGRGMVSSPVESLTCIDGKVTGGKLIEYSLDNSIVIPNKTLTLGLTDGLDSTSFHKYTGNSYDSRYKIEAEVLDVDNSGNPLLVKSSDGMPVSYQWGYSSAYPTAIVSDAANTYQEKTVWTPSYQSRSIYLNPNNIAQNVRTYTFTSYETGDVTLRLSGALGYDWFVPGSFDAKSFGLVQMRSMLPMAEPWNRYVGAYTYTVTFRNVSKGTHTLNIMTPDMRKGSSGGSNDMGLLTYSYMGRTGHVVTSGQDEYLYENFESLTNSEIYPFGYFSDKCLVGEYQIDLKGDSGKKYLLDYRVYRNGKWDYVRKSLPGRSYTIDEGLCPIDDVRVWPEDADIETYSWLPLIGLGSRTDSGGVTESYGYDVCGRLQSVKNNSGYIINQYEYNYAGNSPQTESPYYGNVQMSMSFLSNSCNQSEGELPVPVTYTVPSYTYSSTLSQSDANRMAFDDIVANGQQYADEHGKCESYVIVSVYNPTPESYTLEYSWGVQGNIQYLRFHIPPGEYKSSGSRISDNFKPTVIFVPRHNYRSAMLYNNEGDTVPFTAESGYVLDFFYTKDYYPDYKDTYIIQ